MRGTVVPTGVSVCPHNPGPPCAPSQVGRQLPALGSLRAGLHFMNRHIKALVFGDSLLCGSVVWHLLSFKTLLANCSEERYLRTRHKIKG